MLLIGDNFIVYIIYIMTFENLCTPAYVYLLLSIFGIVIVGIQNLGKKKEFCFGGESCIVSSTPAVFAFKGLFVIFWTLLLNKLCESGYSGLAWFLLLLPLIFFVMAFMFLAAGSIKKHSK